jgi:hypothetical protein
MSLKTNLTDPKSDWFHIVEVFKGPELCRTFT